MDVMLTRRTFHLLLLQAFDDCTTLAATFKLLESFEGLLERDAIAVELAKKHLTMVAAFADDVKEVHELFQAHQEFPQLSKNSPPHSGMPLTGGPCLLLGH
jgi:dynein heavy chain